MRRAFLTALLASMAIFLSSGATTASGLEGTAQAQPRSEEKRDLSAQSEKAESRRKVVPLGSRIPRWEEISVRGDVDVVQILQKFANCIVKSKQAEIAELLATLPDSLAERKAVTKLVGKPTACLQQASQMRLRAPLFRGALAEALYKFKIPQPEVLSGQPMRLEYAKFIAALAAGDSDGVDEEDKDLHVVRWVSYCTAHENPAGVDRLVRSDPNTPREIESLRSLRNVMSACLFEKQRIGFNRINVRAALAEALYRMRFQIDENT